MQSLDAFKTSGSWGDLQVELGKYLGLNEPVSLGVLKRSIKDRLFAHYLAVCRDHPAYLEKLLNDPKNEDYRHADIALPASEAPQIPEGDAQSNMKLIAKAGKSLFNWAKSGFSRMDAAGIKQRMAACESCPALSAAPDKIVYKFKLKNETDMRVCNICGCVASRKVQIRDEQCPKEDPDNPGKNRWGQVIEQA